MAERKGRKGRNYGTRGKPLSVSYPGMGIKATLGDGKTILTLPGALSKRRSEYEEAAPAGPAGSEGAPSVFRWRGLV